MIAADSLAHRRRIHSKVSPGNAQIPSHLYLLHLHSIFPYEHWALEICASLPKQSAFYVVLVHQVSALLSASFMQVFTDNTLAAQLVLPLIGRTEDLSLF
ncbi:hypothetical protein, partial [Marinoscillum furvescens]|uniref:hypothetical protein n=1 Tax=Marinoscillum furvescens TaxID=1026 RepID=UPI001C87D844